MTTRFRPRAPSIGIDARHRCRARLPRTHLFSSRLVAKHPFRPGRSRSSVTKEQPTRAIRSDLRHPRGRRRQPTERCFSPTSATDLQYEHQRTARFPRFERLAAPSTWVESSVDAVPPASGEHCDSLLPERSAVPERRCSAAAFSAGAELEARPLTFQSPPGPFRARRSKSDRPRPLPPRSRQRARPPRPGTPSLDRCSHVSRLRAPENPPPFSWLCRHRAGFKHLSTPPTCAGRAGLLRP